MTLFEIKGETVALDFLVNVSKVFISEKTRKHCIALKPIGRESGFIFEYDTDAEAEAMRREVIEKWKKA